MNVFITGATGFVGRHVCEAFVADGARVSAFVRPGTPTARVPSAAIRIQGELDDKDGILRAMSGMDVVIHLAGLAHVRSELGDSSLNVYRKVNVEGTNSVASAAADVGARFVLMSSVAAVTAHSSDSINESYPTAPATPYGISKLEAERLVHDLASRRDLSAAILRPPMIYGPGMRGNPLRLFAYIDRGLPVPVAAKDSRRSLAFVGNVASAIIAVARLRTPFAETFFVDDGAAVATSDFVRGIARALGRPARLLRIPAGVLRAIGQAGDFMHRVGAVSPITTRTIEPFVRSLVLDSSKLRRLAPPDHWCSTEDGLQLTAAWYKSR